MLLGILFIAISNLLNIYMPIQIKKGVNKISALADVDNLTDGTYDILWNEGLTLAGLYILFSIGKGFFLFLTRQTIIIMSRYIEYDLKNEIYAHYQKLSMAFFRRNNTGDLMNRISEDVSKVRMYLGPAIMYSIGLVFLFVFALWQMISVSPELTLYVLTPLPIMSVIIYFVSRIMNKKSEIVQKQQSKLSTMAQETFSGIRVLKAYHRQSAFSDEFNRACEDYKVKSLDKVRVEALFMPTIIILIGISTTLTIYIGGMKAIAGEITPGDIVLFLMYVNMLTWPFASIGWVTSIVQSADASQRRINEFLMEEPEIENRVDTPFKLKGNIEFKNVSFTYPDSGIKAIKDLSFKIESGKTLAILGRTGCGKSTVANLICRLYEPDQGDILIDGQNIQDINLNDFRSQTGYVTQEVFLFSASIEDNIGFGLKDNSDHELVKEAAKKADLLSNIMSFEKGFETILGERGITLSGGQKQRLSIARAIIKDPKLLIFDDCLSAVDTETEENILKSLKNEMAGKTSIIISHRVSSIINADKILVLQDGRLVEEGTHQSLFVEGSIYYDLFQKQVVETQNNAV